MIVADPVVIHSLKDAQLDDILDRWHRWCAGQGLGKGYGNKALVCGEFRVSRQHDSENGALDDDLEIRACQTVQFCVEGMGRENRLAIYSEALRCSTGVGCWASAVLPTSREERAALIKTARDDLMGRLEKHGVL